MTVLKSAAGTAHETTDDQAVGPAGAAADSASTRAPTRANVLGELRGTRWQSVAGRSVREELRTNLLTKYHITTQAYELSR